MNAQQQQQGNLSLVQGSKAMEEKKPVNQHQHRKELRFQFETKGRTKSCVDITDNSGRIRKHPPEPVVYFTPEVHNKMRYLVDKCTEEVGWMCLVEQEGDNFVLYDVYIPEQIVCAVETDITDKGMTDLAFKLMDEGKDTSHLYGWFHSHVNMAVTPSMQDEICVAEFLETAPVFIRGIMNKKGDLKVDVYYRDHGIAYTEVPAMIKFDPLTEDDEKLLDESINKHVILPTKVAEDERKKKQEAKQTEIDKNVAASKKNAATEGTQLGFRTDIGGSQNTSGNYKPPSQRNIPDQRANSPGNSKAKQALKELEEEAEVRQIFEYVPDFEQTYGDIYGLAWDEETPITERPRCWYLEEDYILEGAAFDQLISLGELRVIMDMYHTPERFVQSTTD